MTFRILEMIYFSIFVLLKNYYHSIEEILHLGNVYLFYTDNQINRPFYKQVK